MRSAAIFDMPRASSAEDPRRWLRSPAWRALGPVLVTLAGVAALLVLLGAAV